jgi:hypothetical protein
MMLLHPMFFLQHLPGSCMGCPGTFQYMEYQEALVWDILGLMSLSGLLLGLTLNPGRAVIIAWTVIYMS